jgi:hypothetical protein
VSKISSISSGRAGVSGFLLVSSAQMLWLEPGGKREGMDWDEID